MVKRLPAMFVIWRSDTIFIQYIYKDKDDNVLTDSNGILQEMKTCYEKVYVRDVANM